MKNTCIALSTVACLAASTAVAEDVAILIGISEYPFLTEDEQLYAPVSDAIAMGEFLIEHGWFQPDQIVDLLNSKASADGIVKAIRDAARSTQPGDDVLIYFSGHGGRFPDENNDEDDAFDEALLAWDFGASDADLPDRVFAGGILDDWMSLELARLEGRNVTVIVDACHAGTSTRADLSTLGDRVRPRGLPVPASRGATRRAAEVTAEEGTFIERSTADNIQVWAAAAPEQVAWEAGGEGIFTSFFISGIAERRADTNQNGVITSAELLDYTRRSTEAWCDGSELCSARRQGFTPHFEGSADYVLADFTGGPAQTAPVEDIAVVQESEPVEETSIVQETAPAQEAMQQEVVFQDNTAHTPVTLADLFGSSNAAGLSLSIPGGNALRIGQNVQFQVSTNRPGTLVLFDVDPNKQLFQLSPSVISRPNIERVSAPGTIVIPEKLSARGLPIEIEVTGPAGSGELVALLIEDQSIDIERLLGQNREGSAIGDARSFLASLAERLRRMQAQNGTNRALQWSATYLPYTISY